MSALFQPIMLGERKLANRIAVAPMCQYSAVDGNPTEWHLIHLGTLGLSGAGLVMVEATAVSAAGRITHGCLGLYSDENETRLRDTIAAARANSASAFGIQLAHAGRKASSNVPWEGGRPLDAEARPWRTLAPSALAFGEGWHTPRAMDGDDLERTKAEFVAAAQRAARIGFDIVEMHAAHGYLLHQFLSPLSNGREDRYGGPLENRMRFPLEVFAAIRAACPASIAVGARISGSDWMEGGFTLEEAGVFAAGLKELGCAYVDVTSGGLDPRAKVVTGPQYQVPFAEHVRKASGLPVRAVGLIVEPAEAEEIVASGKADMVAIARGFLADPRWPWRAAHALGVELEWPPQYKRATPSSWMRGEGGRRD